MSTREHGLEDLRVRAQRRTMRTLAASQVPGGIGAFAAIAVTTLLAKDIVHVDSLAGIPQASREIGAAITAYGIARISDVRGRRAGLATGYVVCVLGGVLCVVAGLLFSFTILVVGMILVGAGLADTWQARFAATDLALPSRRGRALSVVVWTTTAGAVAGPALAGPAGDVCAALGLPTLTGGFAVGALAALAAGIWVVIRLRPDPLLLARRLDADRADTQRGLRRHLAAIRTHPQAARGITAMAAAHATMLAVMVIAPLQMAQSGITLSIIGIVIAVHIACMYALSPLLGWCSDVAGPRPVILAGAVLMLTGVVLVGAAGGLLTLFTVGLCMVGLGWSCILIAGSSAVTGALPLDDRPGVQGASDSVMGVAGGLAGAAAGFIVGAGGFTTLSIAEGCAAAVVIAAALAMRPARPVS